VYAKDETIVALPPNDIDVQVMNAIRGMAKFRQGHLSDVDALGT